MPESDREAGYYWVWHRDCDPGPQPAYYDPALGWVLIGIRAWFRDDASLHAIDEAPIRPRRPEDYMP